MSRQLVFTITDGAHLPQALTCVESAVRHAASATDYAVVTLDTPPHTAPSVRIIPASDLPGSVVDGPAAKFRGDALRWALKPCALLHFLDHYEGVIYVDNDIYFQGGYEFLWATCRDVLLTPHWRPLRLQGRRGLPAPGHADPPRPAGRRHKFEELVSYSLVHGYFNAGFVAARRPGRPAVAWWRDLCLWKCEVRPEEGLYVDQRYLDLMYMAFKGVRRVSHRGCNIAHWNYLTNRRVRQADGSWLINGRWRPVFSHFSSRPVDDPEYRGLPPDLVPGLRRTGLGRDVVSCIRRDDEFLDEGWNEFHTLVGERRRRINDASA